MFREYQEEVVNNSKALAGTLVSLRHTIVSGGTDTRLCLLDLRPKAIDEARVERVLELASVTVNKNACPGDKSATKPGGLRLGGRGLAPGTTDDHVTSADCSHCRNVLCVHVCD